MASGFGESASMPPEFASYSSNNGSDAGDFECNICFELAQDPIVTLCGHLFCWPCLYRWLHHHSHSHECPVCKALIQEEKLVPLYGRGKTQTDPRSKSYPGIDIPRRPAGQRPETAPAPPPHEANNMPNYGFGLMGGFVPMASARIDATVYGTTSGFPYGFHAFHGAHAHGFPQTMSRGQHADNVLKNLLMLIGVLVVLALLWW
ncbi:E3 ubiquitin-protein ligase RNF185 isoform X2 [Jatropha curcas]|uniref:E3 ubiquitin-protein ligase RNF185 isoform X2 n=1 Tax=Jatropha curcas TaxID=180498 RepID=UPI0005FB66DB|nr:E3 ubiquitin-protein ligase RNF185 isoform X2 [Jatropha curcas]